MMVLFYVMISISLCHITQMRELRINQLAAGAGPAPFPAAWRPAYSKCHTVFVMPLSCFYAKGCNVDVVLLSKGPKVALYVRWKAIFFLGPLGLIQLSVW